MSPPRHFDAIRSVPFEEVLAISKRDTARTHGCQLLDVRVRATSFLPGSAWLAVALDTPREGELPSHLLPAPGSPLIVLSDRPEQALRCAEQLRERGWPADPLAVALPTQPLTTATTAALWKPDRFLEQSLPLLEPALREGEGVEFGCGNGRNLVYLRQRGARVLGIDHLPEALELATERARRHGVPLELLQADLLDPALRPPRRFDVVFCIRFTRLALLTQLSEWLRPRGMLLFHGYGLHEDRPHPRTMRRAIRLSLARARELLPADQWEFPHEPELRDEAGECWISFVAKRRVA